MGWFFKGMKMIHWWTC